jgi:uncharacterized protein YceK
MCHDFAIKPKNTVTAHLEVITMAIRGWVYVMTNKSMPGLVKIGYSTKDPMTRAGKIGTGSPSKYEVVYDVLVYDPQPIEHRVHKILAHKREGEEWFRCGISEAVHEIRTVVNKDKGALTLVMAIIFLLTHSGCATLNKSQMQTNTAYSGNPLADFDTQWKKDEREWLLMVLIVLGFATVLGATISASSGGSGFFLGINN